MYKQIELLVRGVGRSHESFVADWQRDYVPHVTAMGDVVRYQQVLPTEPDYAEFDGVSELYFETLYGLTAALGSEGGGDYAPRTNAQKRREKVVEDEQLLDPSPEYASDAVPHSLSGYALAHEVGCPLAVQRAIPHVIGEVPERTLEAELVKSANSASSNAIIQSTRESAFQSGSSSTHRPSKS